VSTLGMMCFPYKNIQNTQLSETFHQVGVLCFLSMANSEMNCSYFTMMSRGLCFPLLINDIVFVDISIVLQSNYKFISLLEILRNEVMTRFVGLVAERSRVRGSVSCNVVMWRLVHSSIKKWVPYRTRWLCAWLTPWAYNNSMRCVLTWELRYVLGVNRSESGIIIL